MSVPTFRSFGRSRVTLLHGDITRQSVDAIVNAANERLIGGGGVDGAIHRVGGTTIMLECDRIRASAGGCPIGQAVVTSAGKLPCRYVIHTVGPIWRPGYEDEADRLLASAYRSSLERAEELKLRVIAFPSISTGVYGFPIERAAFVALSTIRAFLLDHEEVMDEVRMVLFSKADFDVYAQALDGLD